MGRRIADEKLISAIAKIIKIAILSMSKLNPSTQGRKMQLASYPKIGTKAKYIRSNPQTKQVEEGETTILAICLDHNKRLMAHMLGQAEGQNFNVDVKCLDPSDDYKEKFRASVLVVQSLSEVGNSKSAEIVAEYNQRIEKAWNEALGVPVVFDA